MLRKDFRMLKLEYLFENYELAREALALWEHDEDNLEEMLGYFRISSNAVILLQGRAGSVSCGWLLWGRRRKRMSGESWNLSVIC